MTYFVILIVGSTTPEEKVILTLWLKSIVQLTFLYFETFWSLEIVEKRVVNNKSTADFGLVSTLKSQIVPFMAYLKHKVATQVRFDLLNLILMLSSKAYTEVRLVFNFIEL